MKRNVITQKNLVILLLVLCFITSSAEQIFAQIEGRAVKFTNNEKKEIRVAIAGSRALIGGGTPLKYEFSVSGWYIIKPGETKTLQCGHFEIYIAFNDRTFNPNKMDVKYFAVHHKDRFLMIQNSTERNADVSLIIGYPPVYNDVYWGDPQGRSKYATKFHKPGWETLKEQGWEQRPFLKCKRDTKRVIMENGNVRESPK
ncbi:MAG: hypothetical protein LBC74_11955 [Planctomycetaceae bacterium]|jgi:hypothetical protein|nr:hypothetical protein [Planctomycetaceae bacterium]